MIITIETSDVQETKHLLEVLKSLNIKTVSVQAATPRPTVIKGNKKLDPKALFGIWKDTPRTLEQIRQTAWLSK